jgi:hypothetical protein
MIWRKRSVEMNPKKLFVFNLVQLPLSLLGLFVVVRWIALYNSTPVPRTPAVQTSPAPSPSPVQADPNAPAFPGNQMMRLAAFTLVQVFEPGRALATEEHQDRVILLVGIPRELVDGDTWSGWVLNGENFQYTAVAGGAATVRSYVVSSVQNPGYVRPNAVEAWANEGLVPPEELLKDNRTNNLQSLANVNKDIQGILGHVTPVGDLRTALNTITGILDSQRKDIARMLSNLASGITQADVAQAYEAENASLQYKLSALNATLEVKRGAVPADSPQLASIVENIALMTDYLQRMPPTPGASTSR